MDLPQEAAAYAHADFEQINQAFADRLIELAGDTKRARCLELGTGPADIPIRVMRLRSDWRIMAIDTSPPMLGFARLAVGQAGLIDSIDLMLADAKATGLERNAFDVIFSNSILHHISDTVKFWQEIRRLGKSGAWVLIRDLNRPADANHAQKIVDKYAADESDLLRQEFTRSLMAAYTPQEVLSQLAVAGLDYLTVKVVTDRHMDVFGQLE